MISVGAQGGRNNTPDTVLGTDEILVAALAHHSLNHAAGGQISTLSLALEQARLAIRDRRRQLRGEPRPGPRLEAFNRALPGP